MLEPGLQNPLSHETYTFNYIIIETFFPQDSSLLKVQDGSALGCIQGLQGPLFYFI